MVRLAVALVLALAAVAAGDDGISPSVDAPAGPYAGLVGLLDMPVVHAELPSDDPPSASRAPRIDVRGQPAA
jgi:hypothetical protein